MAVAKGVISDTLKRRDENIRVLIKEVKVRNHLTNDQLADVLGISKSTLIKRQADPGLFEVKQISRLALLAGITPERRGELV